MCWYGIFAGGLAGDTVFQSVQSSKACSHHSKREKVLLNSPSADEHVSAEGLVSVLACLAVQHNCCLMWLLPCCVCVCAQVQGTNGLVARWNHFGFAATAEARQLRDVAGQLLQVSILPGDQDLLVNLRGGGSFALHAEHCCKHQQYMRLALAMYKHPFNCIRGA